MVAGNAICWSYTLTPDGTGTSLTESWAVQPAGFAMFAELFGSEAQAQLDVRRNAACPEYPQP